MYAGPETLQHHFLSGRLRYVLTQGNLALPEAAKPGAVAECATPGGALGSMDLAAAIHELNSAYFVNILSTFTPVAVAVAVTVTVTV